jgi:signal transduction histidine kinase
METISTGNSKKVLALVTSSKQNRLARHPSHNGRFTVALSTATEFSEPMNDSLTPPNDEAARLRALVADYEKKMTDTADLIARVRHEINNPLAALLGQAQLLLREDLPDKPRRRVETIESLAVRIKEIAAELRTIQTPIPTSGRES